MAKHIYLQPNERSELEQMIKSGMHAAQAMGRCRALLLLNRSQGKKRTVKEVCEAAMVNSVTIHNIKQRYFAGGIPSVPKTKEQPGRPTIKMTGEVEAHLIALACNEPPEGYASMDAPVIGRPLGGTGSRRNGQPRHCWRNA